MAAIKHDLYGRDLLARFTKPGTAERQAALAAVHSYFHDGKRSGREFERLGRNAQGVDPNPNVITPTDLVAVTMLDVTVPARVSLELLGPRAEEISRLLRHVQDSPLHEVDASAIGPGSDAWKLWDQVRIPGSGMGRTKTSKLLARMRPNLLPISDSRVDFRMQIGPRESFWSWWHRWWSQPGNAESLAALRSEVSGVDDISLLRIVDVAVWCYDVAARPTTRR